MPLQLVCSSLGQFLHSMCDSMTETGDGVRMSSLDDDDGYVGVTIGGDDAADALFSE